MTEQIALWRGLRPPQTDQAISGKRSAEDDWQEAEMKKMRPTDEAARGEWSMNPYVRLTSSDFPALTLAEFSSRASAKTPEETWRPVILPFYKDPNFSWHLPTANDIRQHSNLLSEDSGVRVVTTSTGHMVKYGKGVTESEGQALAYLQQEVSGVCAPRLYAMYYDSEELFLIMESKGVPLNSIWPLLTSHEKGMIGARLRAILVTLQDAECPWPDFFGGMDGTAVHHSSFYKEDSSTHLGPFVNESSFCTARVENSRAKFEAKNLPDYKIRPFERHIANLPQNRLPRLTHGDIRRENIVVIEEAWVEGRAFDVVLVNWERAGWLPEFWEAFCALSPFDSAHWEQDWEKLKGEVVDMDAPKVPLMLIVVDAMR